VLGEPVESIGKGVAGDAESPLNVFEASEAEKELAAQRPPRATRLLSS